MVCVKNQNNKYNLVGCTQEEDCNKEHSCRLWWFCFVICFVLCVVCRNIILLFICLSLTFIFATFANTWIRKPKKISGRHIAISQSVAIRVAISPRLDKQQQQAKITNLMTNFLLCCWNEREFVYQFTKPHVSNWWAGNTFGYKAGINWTLGIALTKMRTRTRSVVIYQPESTCQLCELESRVK